MPEAATTTITVQRKLKQSNRHLWPLYGELTAMFVVFGVFIATYKGK